MHNISEILAPAGTFEAMEAAVKAGADAVYLGGDLFSARAFAGNFDKENLIKAIQYCHLFGVKVHMTVNTLFKEQEILKLTEYMRPFYEAGLDAVIVQDLGAAMILKREFPKLKLHASTQMSISSHYGAEFLKKLGFTRIVPARELSLKEIVSIKEKTGIEIETFIHGAMCFAYSGKCLFSSMLGGRSGNRGRCAQPCRQLYNIKGTDIHEYIMSLKDTCTLNVLPQLIDAGIDSFKIEGRMKNPFYVAATVRAYVKARDYYQEHYLEKGKSWISMSEKEKKDYLNFADVLTDDMKDIFNRGGFHTGYYFTDNGSEMAALNRPNHNGLKVGTVKKIEKPKIFIELQKPFHAGDVFEIRSGVGDENPLELTSGTDGNPGSIITVNGRDFKKLRPGQQVYRTRNKKLIDAIETDILKKEKKIKVEARVTALEGKPLKVSMGGITLEGSIIEKAGNRAVTADDILDKMKKTGGSNVELETAVELDAGVFVPMSELNALRRDAIEKYKNSIIEARACRD